jgi:peptidoglycan/xylan/chitin deacetylase (PgdA/CDA1 family)
MRRGRRALIVVVAALAGAAAAPARAMARAVPAVPILMYHHISPAPHAARHPALWVTASSFRQEMDALARAGYVPVTLERVWRAWHGDGTLPRAPIVLSFDDGYASQYRVAARILRARRWVGVLNLELHDLASAGGVTATEVRRMVAAGWEVDAHSLTHPDLTKVDAARLRREVAASRAAIRATFGVPADFFSYPFGRFDAAVQAAVRSAGYLGATTTRTGVARPGSRPYALPRILVDGRHSARALVDRLRVLAAER